MTPAQIGLLTRAEHEHDTPTERPVSGSTLDVVGLAGLELAG